MSTSPNRNRTRPAKRSIKSSIFSIWTATFVVASQKMLFFVHQLEGFGPHCTTRLGLADAIMNALEYVVHSTEPHSFRITYSGDSNYSIVGATEGSTSVHQAIVSVSGKNGKPASPPLSEIIRLLRSFMRVSPRSWLSTEKKAVKIIIKMC